MRIIKQIFQYMLALAIAGSLFFYAYRDFNFGIFLAQLQFVKLGWILTSVLLTLGSHLVRAYRWKLLLQSLGFRFRLFEAFIALMVGYVSNLWLPRLGEVVRCTVLKKHTGIPTSTLLGTVVAERVIDLVSLVGVLGLTLMIAFKQIKAIFYNTLWVHIDPQAIKVTSWVIGVVILIVSLISILIKRKNSTNTYSWLSKIQLFWKGIWQGINSISSLNTKKTTSILTILMWILYYLAGYVGIFAITETSNLNWLVGLPLLTMSAISLTLPIQGGIGAYHLLVSSVLIMYGISKDSAMLYVTLMHTSQLLMTLVAGGISAFLGLFFVKKPVVA